MNFAQQIRVDPQDNIWIVDAGSNQIVKFDPDGRYLMVLGRKPENIGVRPGTGMPASAPDVEAARNTAAPERGRGGEGGGGGRGGAAPGAGINGDGFSRPSDVTWDRAGNIYVADGYGTNNRIAKFTKDGNFVKTWGSTGAGQGQFNQIRGIASDAAGNIYVADAGNKRIQVFDGNGTFKSQITNSGRRRRSASQAAAQISARRTPTSGELNGATSKCSSARSSGDSARPARWRRGSAWSKPSTAGRSTISGLRRSGTSALRK